MNNKKLSLIIMSLLLIGFAATHVNLKFSANNPQNLVIGSVVLAVLCFINIGHLFGWKNAIGFFISGVLIGWCAEEIGVRTGWLFGAYYYTDVLGKPIGSVPWPVPLIWFSATYITMVVAKLITLQRPAIRKASAGLIIWLGLLAAMLTTAWDLALDPYMVHVAKAWVMTEGGHYFGEPIHGFVGWMLTTFIIVGIYLWLIPRLCKRLPEPHSNAALIPVLAYMVFAGSLVATGEPIATRPIAFFAMGIPIMAALAGWYRWKSRL